MVFRFLCNSPTEMPAGLFAGVKKRLKNADVVVCVNAMRIILFLE